MSSRSAQIRLSPKARQDFIDILRYTGETWGNAQLAVYRDKIDAGLQAIARNPQMGQRRSDLPPLLFGYLVGAHIIIYRPEPDGIAVSRILHQRMSLARHV